MNSRNIAITMVFLSVLLNCSSSLEKCVALLPPGLNSQSACSVKILAVMQLHLEALLARCFHLAEYELNLGCCEMQFTRCSLQSVTTLTHVSSWQRCVHDCPCDQLILMFRSQFMGSEE